MPRREPPLSNVPTPIAIAAGLKGAVLLARARPWGLLLFESTPSGAARSFVAMLVCLPAYLVLQSLDSDGIATVDPLRTLAAMVIGFAVAWLGFAAVSHSLASMLGRADNWPRFLSAWNWSNVVQYGAMLLVAPVSMLGLPDPVAQTLSLVALGYALWLEWYVTRLALAIPGLAAMAFVMVDVAIALMVSGVIVRISLG